MATSLPDVESIFCAAIDLATPEECRVYVQSACGGNEELRQRVEKLLQAHFRAGNFLESPATTLQAASDQAIEERPGTVIGPYKLLQQIGEGGMGVVFLAEQSRPVQRKVALKIIKPGMDTRQVIARFAAEQQALALMDHPNIARVFDAGTTESGRPYFVMELVKGVPITDYCDQQRLTPRQRLELFIPTCHALQHAHQKGIIHRDLKPSNVLVALYDGQPVPKVIDFGVAKATGPKLTERTLFTEFGQVVGTLEYMSPEQAELNQLDVDTRSDIYSLGVLLYELLTGTTPFERKRFKATAFLELLRVIREDEPAKPSTWLSTTEELPSIAANRSLEPKRLSGMLRGDLDWIVMKALEKDRSRRYETANALSRDLQRFLVDEPVEASPPSTTQRVRRFVRRNKRTAVAAAAVAIIAVVSTTAALAYRSQLFRAELAETAEKGAKQEALVKLWDSYVVAARAGRMSRRPGQRFDSLRAVEKALTLPVPPGRSKDELRTEAIASLLLPDLEVAKEWPGWPRGTTAVAIDQAFQRYARGDANGKVSIRRVNDDAELFQLPGEGPLADYGGLAFSADGRFLTQACQSPQGLRRRVWKLDGPRPAVVLSCDMPFAFSPDSRQFAAGYPDGSIRLYDLETGRELNRYELAGFVPNWLGWNPRRPLLAAADDRSAYHLLSLATGKFEAAVSVPGVESSWDWHPEGRLLAVADQDARPKITLWDTSTGHSTMPPMESHKTQGVLVCFNHAGDRLLSTDWAGLWRLWDTRTGQLLLTQPAGAGEMCFSHDDGLVGLAATPQGLRFFRFRSGREMYTVGHHVNSIAVGYTGEDEGSCRLDRDGRLLAIPASDGVAVVDVVRGEEVALLPLGDSVPIGLEPSGAMLTHGTAGVLRWPMAFDAATGERVYGPPQALAPTMASSPGGIGNSADGRVLAFPASNDGARELLLPAGREFQLTDQEDVRHCAVSPDGLWVVTGSHGASKGPAAKVWDARTGSYVRDLPVAEYCYVSFSPDGKWLLTSGGGARLWSVGSWDEGPKLGNSASRGAFSADGSLLALQDEPGVVRLVVPDTGREVSRLTAPESNRLIPLCFTRDKRRLVCRSGETQLLHIFDLGLIRAQLAAMGLDWDAPSYPAQSDAPPDRVSVRVVGTDLLDPAQMAAAHERDQAIHDVLVNPFDPPAQLQIGILLTEAGHEQAGNFFLSLALAVRPELPEARSLRARTSVRRCGDWYVSHDRWQEAAADFVLLTRLDPQASGTYLQAAALLLTIEDRAGYRRICQEMLEQFRDSTNSIDAERTVKACLITDELKRDQTQLSKLAKVAVQDGDNSSSRKWFQFARGLAEYREAHYADSLDWFNRSRQSNAGPTAYAELDALNHLFEAMALHQLGRGNDARHLLGTTAAQVDRRFGWRQSDPGWSWHEWLLCRVARDEAKRLLAASPKTTEPSEVKQ